MSRRYEELTRQIWSFVASALMVLGVLAPVSPVLAQSSLAAKVVEYNIPAQPLESALQQVADKLSLQILYSPTDVRGVTTRGLKGSYSAKEAIERLIEGTGLTVSTNGSNVFAIKPAGGTRDKTSEAAASMRVAQEGDRPSRSFGQKSGEGVQLETIMVTAQKREERLIDVPSSIAVVTRDDIDRRGLVSAEDYLRGIPGANQADGRSGQTIVIRGIESATISQNFGSGPTTATYFGETPTTNTAGVGGDSNVDIKLVDIERVEVLRGPQGTAFGNSSMGGAVRTIPVAPKLDRFEGKVAAGYSVTSGTGGDNYNGQAVVNIPLIKDKLAIRGVAYQYQDSGFYRNVAGSDPAFRAAMVTPYGAEAFAIDKEEVGSYYAIGGRVAALFQVSNDLRFTLSLLSQKSERDGIPLANSGVYEQTLLLVAPEHVVRGQKGGLSDTDIDIANATMEYNLGWANLLATYSHTKSGSMQSFPYLSYGLPWAASTFGNSDHREHVGEIRLATQLDGPWNFLAGLYAEKLEDEGLTTYFWLGDPATNFLARGQRLLGIYHNRPTLTQKAAFGEASWELLQGLTLTGGVRAYKYDRTFQLDASGPFFGGDAGTHERREGKDSGANYRANLGYKLDDGALLYAGWSQGFRLGRLQSGLPPGPCDRDGDGIADGTNTTIESTRHVDSDSVDSYELGTKLTMLDRRLAIAADVFRMEWSGMPVRVFGALPPSGCAFTYFANVGDALSEGVEFQANFQITKAFRLDFGGSWIHARLTEDVPALNASKGNRLPGAPKVNANLGLHYEFSVGGHKAFVRADSIYVGSFYGNLQESPNTKSGGYIKLDASARVAIRNVNIDLFVRNVTNKDTFTFRGDYPLVGQLHGYRLRPRTIGLQLGYTF